MLPWRCCSTERTGGRAGLEEGLDEDWLAAREMGVRDMTSMNDLQLKYKDKVKAQLQKRAEEIKKEDEALRNRLSRNLQLGKDAYGCVALRRRLAQRVAWASGRVPFAGGGSTPAACIDSAQVRRVRFGRQAAGAGGGGAGRHLGAGGRGAAVAGALLPGAFCSRMLCEAPGCAGRIKRRGDACPVGRVLDAARHAQACGREQDCLDVYKSLEANHPVKKIRKQARDGGGRRGGSGGTLTRTNCVAAPDASTAHARAPCRRRTCGTSLRRPSWRSARRSASRSPSSRATRGGKSECQGTGALRLGLWQRPGTGKLRTWYKPCELEFCTPCGAAQGPQDRLLVAPGGAAQAQAELVLGQRLVEHAASALVPAR